MFNLDVLFHAHFNPGKKKSGQTYYALAELAGYLYLLHDTTVYVVLDSAIGSFEAMLEDWLSRTIRKVKKQSDDYELSYEKHGHVYTFVNTRIHVVLLNRSQLEDVKMMQEFDDKYVIYDESGMPETFFGVLIHKGSVPEKKSVADLRREYAHYKQDYPGNYIKLWDICQTLANAYHIIYQHDRDKHGMNTYDGYMLSQANFFDSEYQKYRQLAHEAQI